MTADKTSAVLDRMVSDVVNRKRATPKAGASPVGSASVPQEAPKSHGDAGNGSQGTVTPVGTVIPLEVTGSITQAQQAIAGYLVEIEQALSHIRFNLELLFQPLRMPTIAAPVDVEALRKQAEVEADARAFERKLKEQAEAAQAATWEAAKDRDRHPAEPDTWLCPDHGKSIWKTSPKGRRYLACPDCNEFERVAR